MTEDPRVSQEHPRLQRWIKRRKRDQAWGDKWFPIFPDILFYVKGFLKTENNKSLRKNLSMSLRLRLVRQLYHNRHTFGAFTKNDSEFDT